MKAEWGENENILSTWSQWVTCSLVRMNSGVFILTFSLCLHSWTGFLSKVCIVLVIIWKGKIFYCLGGLRRACVFFLFHTSFRT